MLIQWGSCHPLLLSDAGGSALSGKQPVSISSEKNLRKWVKGVKAKTWKNKKAAAKWLKPFLYEREWV